MKKLILFLFLFLIICCIPQKTSANMICDPDGYCTSPGPVITILNNFPTYIKLGTSQALNQNWYNYATAFDNLDGNITHNITYTTNYNPYSVGIYYVTYSVFNSKGVVVEKTVWTQVFR